MVRRGPDPLVEPGVELRVADSVAGRDAGAHLDDHLVQVVKVPTIRPGGGPAGEHALQGGANLLDLEGFPVRDQANASTAVALEHDEPLLVEPDQGGPDGGAPGSGLGRDGRLDQALVGLETALD